MKCEKCIYLNTKLYNDIYMKLPLRPCKLLTKVYCKLNKVLYGMNQTGHQWNQAI